MPKMTDAAAFKAVFILRQVRDEVHYIFYLTS
jgi:hypothetical protein